MGSTRNGAFLVFRFRDKLLLLIFLIDTVLPPSEEYFLSDPKKATRQDYKRLFCRYLCIYRAARYPFTVQLYMHLHVRRSILLRCLHICDDTDNITIFQLMVSPDDSMGSCINASDEMVT